MGIKYSLDTNSISCTHIPPRTLIWCRRTWIYGLEASITPGEIKEYSLPKKQALAQRKSSNSFPNWMRKMGRAADSSSAAVWSTREQVGNLQGMIKSHQSDISCKVSFKRHPLETSKAWSPCAHRRVSNLQLMSLKQTRFTSRTLMRLVWSSCRKASVSINLPARPITGSIPQTSPHPSEGRFSCFNRISRKGRNASHLCPLMMNVSRSPPR